MTSSTEYLWSGFSRANELNPAQRHRWRLVLEEVFRDGALPADGLVVDLGCGSGTLLSQLKQRELRLQCVGFDVEPLALELARKAVPDGVFHCADLGGADPDATPASIPRDLAGKADVVVCSEVLEHVEHAEKTVSLAAALLRLGGRFVVTVPAGAITPFDRAIGHLRHYDNDSLARLLQRDGLRIERLYRWGFPFHSLFRAAVGMCRLVPSACTDERFGAGATFAFRALDVLFRLNAKSRRRGRQLVAVAAKSPAG